jgi:pimeloyl-ACP methyl ester carboxylesterase
MLHHADTRDLATKFKMPVLVLTGEQDGVVIPARSKEMASLIPEVQMEQISGVGHAGYLENSNKFNLALENFLNA